MIKTKEEVFTHVDEGLLREMHHASSQQGAEYMYTCVHNEFEWAVCNKQMSIEQANSMLKDFATDIGVEPKTVNKDYLLGIVKPYSLRPSNRKNRSF